MRTRGSENQVSVDLHLLVAPDATVERGHEIAHAVETEIRTRFSQVTDVVVHVEPAGPATRAGRHRVVPRSLASWPRNDQQKGRCP